MMLVCLRDDGIIREEWSSGDKMADQGRSLVPPAGPEDRYFTGDKYGTHHCLLYKKALLTFG